MPEGKVGDEVDLLHLLVKAIFIVRRYFALIVICTLTGAIIGLAWYFTGRKTYESKMIVSSGILTDSYTTILFNNINRHLWEGNPDIVAKQLGVTTDVVKDLQSLKIEGIRVMPGGDTKELDRFTITARITDQKIILPLQKGILYYLENNEYVKIRIMQNRKTIRQMLTAVEKEIADISKLKTSILSGEFFKSANGNVMFDPTVFNSKILELNEKRLAYENGLELSDSVYVIEGFTQFEKQAEPKLLVSLLAGIGLGLMSSFAVMFVIALNKLVKRSQTQFG